MLLKGTSFFNEIAWIIRYSHFNMITEIKNLNCKQWGTLRVYETSQTTESRRESPSWNDRRRAVRKKSVKTCHAWLNLDTKRNFPSRELSNIFRFDGLPTKLSAFVLLRNSRSKFPVMDEEHFLMYRAGCKNLFFAVAANVAGRREWVGGLE